MRWVVYALLASNLGLLAWNLASRGGVAPAAMPPAAAPGSAAEVGELPLLSEIGKQALRTRSVDSADEPEPPPGDSAAPDAVAAAPAPDTPVPEVDAGGTGDAPPARTGAAGPLEEPPPATCLTVGPLDEEAPLDAIRTWLAEQGAEVDVRTDERREVALYWVYFPPRESRDVAVDEVERMRARGIDDVIVVPKGDMTNAISLGVFSRTDTRDRRLRELNALGYEPLTSPRYRTKVATWVDVVAEAGELDAGAVAARWPQLQVAAGPCPDAQIAAGAGRSYNSAEEGSAPRRYHFSGSDVR